MAEDKTIKQFKKMFKATGVTSGLLAIISFGLCARSVNGMLKSDSNAPRIRKPYFRDYRTVNQHDIEKERAYYSALVGSLTLGLAALMNYGIKELEKL